MENFPELKNWGFQTEKSHQVPNTIHENRSMQGLPQIDFRMLKIKRRVYKLPER